MTDTGMLARKVSVLSISNVFASRERFSSSMLHQIPSLWISKGGWTQTKRVWNHQCLQSYVTNPNLRPFLASVSLDTSTTTIFFSYTFWRWKLRFVTSFAQKNGLHIFALFQGCLKTSIGLPTTPTTRSVWVSLDPSCQTTIQGGGQPGK